MVSGAIKNTLVLLGFHGATGPLLISVHVAFVVLSVRCFYQCLVSLFIISYLVVYVVLNYFSLFYIPFYATLRVLFIFWKSTL